MDYRAWGFWLTVAQWTFNIVVLIWMAISRKHQANNKRVKELEASNAGKIDEKKAKQLIEGHAPSCKNAIRINALELEIKKLPSRTELQQVNESMASLSKEVSESTTVLSKEIGKLQGQLGGINRAVDLINQFLIEQGGKK